MKTPLIIPAAEPFFMKGGQIGCVLVHGFTGAPKEMRLMGDTLHASGLSVVGVRLAGHSTRPGDMIRTRWQDWLACVEDGYHYLRGQCRHIFLAGLSLGGILCLKAASYLQVNGVIAMAVPYQLPRDWRLQFAKPFSHLVPWVKKSRSDTRDQKTARHHVDYPAYPTRSIAEVHALTKSLQQTLPDIHCPVLLIYSRADQTVPDSHANLIKKHLGSNHCEVNLINDSGHVLTEDVQRDVVFQICLQFINKVVKA